MLLPMDQSIKGFSNLTSTGASLPVVSPPYLLFYLSSTLYPNRACRLLPLYPAFLPATQGRHSPQLPGRPSSARPLSG